MRKAAKLHGFRAMAPLLALCAGQLLAANAAAGEIVVAPNGADTGKGTSDAPLKSIQAALERAMPGDVVKLRPGTYKQRIRSVRSGAPGRPIVLTGQNAIIASPESYEGRLVSLYHDNIEIRGLTLTGGDILLSMFGVRGARIVGNRITDAGGECVRIRYLSSRNEISGNQISGCGRKGFNLSADKKNGEGIYIGTAPEQLSKNAKEKVPDSAARGKPSKTPDMTSDNTITGNTIDVPAECVDMKEATTGNRVSGNTCSGNRDPESGGFSSRGDGNIITGNTLKGKFAGAGVRLGGDKDGQGVRNVVTSNTLLNTGGYALKDERQPQAQICGNTIGNNQAGISKSGVDPSVPCT